MEKDHISEPDFGQLFDLLTSIFDCSDGECSTGFPLPNFKKYGLPYKDKEQCDVGIQNCSNDAENSSNSSSSTILNTEAKKPSKEESQEVQTYPKRIRKSKYSDICGDLSHIRRDPKLIKRKRIVEEVSNQSKIKQRKTDSSSNTESSEMYENKGLSNIKESEKEKEDGLLVQELMKFLFHPKTPDHQNCALAILSSDEKLMRLFLKEKDKMHHQSYPVKEN